jgi:hypothetical protein
LDKITSDEQLDSILKKAIDNSNKESVKILAGHLPMIYKDFGPGHRAVDIDSNRWGIFSMYTFEKGVKLLRYALDTNKEGGLLVLVDDIVELPEKELPDGKIIKMSNDWAKRKRKAMYKNAELPDEYKEILEAYDISESFVIPQIRDENTKSILISEKMTRAVAHSKKLTAPNECSQAYKGVLYDPQFFDFKKDYLVSFIPGQCKGNICDGFLDTLKNIDAMHIFFPHIEDMGGMLALKEGYQKLFPVMNVKQIFQMGVFYRADKAV